MASSERFVRDGPWSGVAPNVLAVVGRGITMVLLAGAFTGAAADVAADETHRRQAETTSPPSGDHAAKISRDARAYFTDTEVLDQTGNPLRFYSDVLEGRVVVINVMFTSCQDACPLITQALNNVRAQLGERFGKDIFFISISSDPERDSPQALKKFAEKQNADDPGWTFLTGKKENIDFILKRLGQFNPQVEDHSTLLIAGNVPAKRWSKMLPNISPVAIAERIKLLADGSGAAGGASGATR